jgi:hypothetical protein
VNKSLRERDERKDNAMAMLSDQLLTITERLKEQESDNFNKAKKLGCYSLY